MKHWIYLVLSGVLATAALFPEQVFLDTALHRSMQRVQSHVSELFPSPDFPTPPAQREACEVLFQQNSYLLLDQSYAIYFDVLSREQDRRVALESALTFFDQALAREVAARDACLQAEPAALTP